MHAQKIADAIAAFDVWMDINHLEAGESIQGSIDEALRQVDVVLAVWSKQASKSNGVEAELTTCQRVERIVIPCLIDDTPLSGHLNGILGIDFRVWDTAIMRLQQLLFNKLALQEGIMDEQQRKLVKEYDGILNYLSHSTELKHELTEEEKDFWENRLNEMHEKAFASYQATMDRLTDTKTVMNGLMEKYGKVKDDAEGLKQLRAEVEANEMLMQDRKMYDKFLELIDASIRECPEEEQEQPTDQALEQVSQRISSIALRDLEVWKQQYGHLVPAQNFEHVHYYVIQATGVLRQFDEAIRNLDNQALGRVYRELYNYLLTDADILPASTQGLLGYLDDAWLIHNTVYRCMESGLLSRQGFTVDWNRITMGDAVVRTIFATYAPNALGMLNNLMLRYMQMLGAAAPAYQPQFHYQNHNYFPFM